MPFSCSHIEYFTDINVVFMNVLIMFTNMFTNINLSKQLNKNKRIFKKKKDMIKDGLPQDG